MKQIICLLGILCLVTKGNSQILYWGDGNYMFHSSSFEKSRPYLGTRVGDIPLGKIINYKNPTATLSDFDGKLVILDFWFTHCGSCLEKFPEEAAIQKKYGEEIQIIPVTYEPKDKIEAFLKNWEKTHSQKLPFPFIVHDTLLEMQFGNPYCPYYIFIQPDGNISGMTGADMVTEGTIEGMLKNTRKINAILKKENTRYRLTQAVKDFKNPERYYRDTSDKSKYRQARRIPTDSFDWH